MMQGTSCCRSERTLARHRSIDMLHTDQSLRDLQGGVYRDGVVLSDPVILSRDRQYGVTDLGAATHSNVTWQPVHVDICRSDAVPPHINLMLYPLEGTVPPRGHGCLTAGMLCAYCVGTEGISSFFSQHTCNEYCRSRWSLPRDRTPYLCQQRGTSMVQWRPAAPTWGSRPAMTVAPSYYGQQQQLYDPYDDDDDYLNNDDNYPNNDDDMRAIRTHMSMAGPRKTTMAIPMVPRVGPQTSLLITEGRSCFLKPPVVQGVFHSGDGILRQNPHFREAVSSQR